MDGHNSSLTIPTVAPTKAVSRGFAWAVFAVSFGLMLSDYMSRQVLNAVFPALKLHWLLSDGRLGSLNSVVALMVGLLTFPLSLLADRWGRARSLVIAAVVWSVATLGCAVAANYGQMFVGRFFVGVGEAAYGSVGIAVVLSVFPARLRATVSGAFMSGSAFGSVLGVSLGGVIAEYLGWRWSFGVMGFFGLLMAGVYGAVVRESRLSPPQSAMRGGTGNRRSEAVRIRTLLPRLFSSVSVICAYLGSGLQTFVPFALLAWMPSYLNRYYAMPLGRAGVVAAVFALITGVGVVGIGMVTDRLSQTVRTRMWTVPIVCGVATCVALLIAFSLPVGIPQLVLIGLGTLLSNAGAPAVAMVASLTPGAIAATAFATVTIANNLLGIAPGPVLTGVLADHVGLLGALRVVPLVALLGVVAFAIGRQRYTTDLRRAQLQPDGAFLDQ